MKSMGLQEEQDNYGKSLPRLAARGQENPAGRDPKVATAAQAFGHGLPWLHEPRFRMKMPKDQVWRIEIEGSPLPVRVVSGSVWITEDGDQRDHIIQARHSQGGQRFLFAHRGGATLSALEEAVLEVG